MNDFVFIVNYFGLGHLTEIMVIAYRDVEQTLALHVQFPQHWCVSHTFEDMIKHYAK